VTGDYGTKEKLDNILKTAAAPPTSSTANMQLGNNNSLLKEKLRERAEMDINQEKAFELARFKEEKKKNRLDSMNKEAEYLEK